MKIQKSYWFGIFGVLYIVLCPIILQIEKGIIEYDGSAYYYFSSGESIQIITTILTIVFLLIYGAYCGINKKISSLILFIVMNLIVKVIIFLFGFSNNLFSDLLYNIYFSPISYIYEKIDIFAYIFYEFVFIIAFVGGFCMVKIRNKNNIV